MEQYPKRKHTRLKCYDYTLPGCYYVTIHAAPNAPAFSHIVPDANTLEAKVILMPAGQLAVQQLFALEQRYPNVSIDKYVVMPNHIHIIFRLTEPERGHPCPSLMDVVSAYKSLTTRACNQAAGTPGQKLFQTSFYETVLRNEKAFQNCWQYIEGNPGKWLEGIRED